MMIPEFIRFYGYSLEAVLNEYARSFFALLNSMYQLEAKESLINITNMSTAFGSDNGNDVISNLEKQRKGIGGIVNEVRVIKP